MSVNLDEISDVLLPRRYQEEIFVRAQQGNVIAALDTGSGKTYISTLLMKWIAVQESARGKIVVFLVPKVALVAQQGEFIAKQTSLRVRQFSGMSAHDMSDRSGWRKEIQNTDVFVMTAQIFLNLMTHSHCHISKVSLLIFDECHHARKNHAYNGIMREYFQAAVDVRPKVFGMTASPIWNPRNAADSLATLEKNLDAKVIAVKQHVEELQGHAPRPDEIIRVYPVSPKSYPDYPSPSLRTRMDLDSLPPEIDIQVDKIMTRYDVTYWSLGPFGAEYFLYSEVKQRVEQLIQQALDSTMVTLTPAQYRQLASGASFEYVTKSVHPRLTELESLLAEYRTFFEGPDDGSPPEPIPISWCSPKVKSVFEILFDRYTPTFQGIVFVEQRHITSCLAAILPRLQLLTDIIKCGQLVGHGTTLAKFRAGMDTRIQQDTVKMFRDRELNLLIATSVAEEGLDFPACDLVIRFDPVQHMVGYLQSRGRARHKTSTFIIMVQEGAQDQAERYIEFLQSEPHLKKVYQDRDLQQEDHAPQEEEENETLDPQDLSDRERYVVPSTGAVLTYTSSISLLNHLCSLIPRDKFTPAHVPKYTGDYVATVQLPPSLPLPPELLVHTGPQRLSKKEAKRAAAFLAVKTLHSLNVFDDYLIPAKSNPARENEDPDGEPITDVRSVPEMLNVDVRDPWIVNTTLWLHVVYLDGIPSAGLVTGTPLPVADLVANGLFVSTGDPTEVVLDPREVWNQRRAMEEYTRMGIWWCITGRGITLPLTCYLVPITCDFKVDFDTIALAIAHPFGSGNWDGIGEEHYGQLLYMNNKEFGRPMVLHKLRHDITPSSKPLPGSKASGYDFATYREYWLAKYSRKEYVPQISEDGMCVEGIRLKRNIRCSYSMQNDSKPSVSHQPDPVLIPLEWCRWAVMTRAVYNTFFILPELCHRLTDVYRVRVVRMTLNLPPITDDMLIQATTIPSANAGFNNQRLETYGDAVLKICTVVHLYNKFPHRHEGQLDTMKRVAVANRTLMARALERRLERHITRETQSLRTWRYVVSADEDLFSPRPRRFAPRQFARRSLQDCMEAILGAAFATGGINMALRAGTALGLSMGGPSPWNVRYSHLQQENPVSPLFAELQETLGYQFRNGRLLLEAVSHPSFRSTESSSYQRLEFLGDAVVDMVVTEYLYNKFPHANSGQLSWARSRAVCGMALASVAIKKLGLHKLLLINSVELSVAIGQHVPLLDALSPEEVIVHGWKQDPPKALSDVLESVLGALFVDADYNYDKVAPIVEAVLADLLVVLRPDLPKDPVTEFMIWAAKSGCRCVSFAKSQSRPELRRWDCMAVLVHGVTVAGPLPESNLSMAKGMAAERARAVLSDPDSPHHLARLCVCAQERASAAEGAALAQAAPVTVTVTATEEAAGEDEDELSKEEMDDETDEGFAMLARIMLDEMEDPVADDVEDVEDAEDGDGEDENDQDPDLNEEREVQRMMEIMIEDED